MSIAVWTDGKERVRRKVFDAENRNINGEDFITDEEPSIPEIEYYETAEEYFNESKGFYYEVTGSNPEKDLTEEQKFLLKIARGLDYERLSELEDEYGVKY